MSFQQEDLSDKYIPSPAEDQFDLANEVDLADEVDRFVDTTNDTDDKIDDYNLKQQLGEDNYDGKPPTECRTSWGIS